MISRFFVISFLLLLACRTTEADQWFFKKEVVQDSFEFGDTTIVRTRDSTIDQQWPEFSVAIYRGDELMAKYKGISFEFIFATEDNTDFIGVSNSGIPGTAFVWFRSTGELDVLLNHANFQPEYCSESVTLERHWLDRQSPDLKFEYEMLDWGDGDVEKFIDRITFIDCRGDRVSWGSTYVNGIIRLAEEFQRTGFDAKDIPEPPNN